MTSLLYVILMSFVHSESYDSLDRHLLKLFIETI
jgi:hypothetical protein